MDGFCTPRRELPMRRVAPCHGVLTARMTPTAQAGWKSWYVSAPPGPHEKHRPADVKSELNGAHAAPRQPHMKKVSSFSTNSGAVSLMSNSSANTTTNNTVTRLMSTVLMVRIPFSAFTWVSAARERWDLKCLPCDETKEEAGPKTQKDRQAQCHQRTPVTVSLMSNSSGKHCDDNTTTRLICAWWMR